MSLPVKQKENHRHRGPTGGCQGRGRERLGGWGQEMQAILYRVNTQQGPTVQHGELCLVSCDKP